MVSECENVEEALRVTTEYGTYVNSIVRIVYTLNKFHKSFKLPGSLCGPGTMPFPD